MSKPQKPEPDSICAISDSLSTITEGIDSLTCCMHVMTKTPDFNLKVVSAINSFIIDTKRSKTRLLANLIKAEVFRGDYTVYFGSLGFGAIAIFATA